jgi:type-F conjugative transfer system pilin assembly protein TrbC
MAKKKLLLVVMALILLFLAASSRAEEKVELLAEKVAGADREGFKGIMEKSREIVMSAIAEKYRELLMLRGKQQDGLTEHNSLRGLDEQRRNYRDSSILKVFVSSSMGTELLKTYAKEARRYGGVLVFNGLPDNSWVKLNKTVMEIVGNEEGVGIQIDPEEFDRFNIKTVPAFVLIKEADWITGTSEEMAEDRVTYDKVTGNIGTEAALHLFAEQGELGAMARAKAEKAGND